MDNISARFFSQESIAIIGNICNYGISSDREGIKMALIKKVNLYPGSPVYIGDRTAQEMDLSIISYDTKSAQRTHLSGIGELMQYKDAGKVSWINISGLKDIDSIKQLGDLYGIHPLTIEDILHTDEQPKIEIFDTYRFLSVKTIQLQRDTHHDEKKHGRELAECLIDQVSIIIMKNVLITIQEVPGHRFDGIRKRILEDMGGIRKMGTDYLAYAIIDAVVDEYFLTINQLEEDIEDFEDRATKTSDETFIEKIQDTRKYLLQIRRAITPLKANIIAINRNELFFQNDELRPFLQDLDENLHNAIIQVENHREWLTNIMDVNISVLSYQMNKVMKVLAIISTIFIPLTFIAGVYGMNFQHMPETQSVLGYPLVMCGMGILAGIMVIYFKIRRWF